MELIDIKDISGNILQSVPTTEPCEHVEELMQSDYIGLSWESDQSDILPIGAYIEYNGEKYSLLEPYYPVQNDELKFTYQPQFKSVVMSWGKIPFFMYTYSAGNMITSREPDWELTDNPANFMSVICKAIKNETGEVWTYSVDASLPASATLSFRSVDIFSSLNNIANAFDTEWWADKINKVLHLSKAEHGTPVTLEVGVNINVPSVTNSKEGYYTRFYAFGSTRNIVQDYNGANVNNLVNKRLTLDPVKYPNGYKDIRPGLQQGEIFPKILIFDDIYPSSNLAISDVRVRLMWKIGDDGEKIQVGTDEDGNPIYDQYAIWYFRIPGFTLNNTTYGKNNPNGMLIEGKTLSAHFGTGSLQGREFELIYHDKQETVSSADGTSVILNAGDYEIKFKEEGTYIIPSITSLIPSNGDKVILFNIRMPQEYVDTAYTDLEEEMDKEISRLSSDLNNYNFSSNPVAFNEDNPNLSLGRKVVYVNGDYSYSTRIIRLVTKLDYDFQQDITIGNDKIKGNIQEIKEEVVSANNDINLLSVINNMTSSLQQSYQRTQKMMLDGFLSIKNMWLFDPDNPNTIFTKYNVWTNGFLSAKGLSPGGSGGGAGLVNTVYGFADLGGTFADTDLNNTFNAYTINEIWKLAKNGGGGSVSNISVSGTGNAITGVEKSADGKVLNFTKDTVFATKAEFDALGNKLDNFLTGTDTDNIINKWSELEVFLQGLTETDKLATLLGNKLDRTALGRLFTALDANGNEVDINDTTKTIASIRANYGFWGVDYVSAKGISSGGSGGGGAGALYQLADVLADSTGTGVAGAAAGKALVYDGSHWKAGDAGMNESQLGSYLSLNGYLTQAAADNKYLTQTAAASTYVTLGTAQTITGGKTFSSTVKASTAGVGPGFFSENNTNVWSYLRLKSGSEYWDVAVKDNDSSGALQFRYKGVESNRVLISQSAAVTASSFVKSGGTSSQFLKADGSVDSNTYLTVSTAASTYVKKAGDTMTGALTTASIESSLVIKGVESNDITNRYFANSTLTNTYIKAVTNNLGAIRNALSFKWYNDYWNIGVIRHSSMTTFGFGFADSTNFVPVYIKNDRTLNIDTSHSALAKGSQRAALNIVFPAQGSNAATSIPIISVIGTNETTGYNQDVRIGSITGATWISAGESGANLQMKLDLNDNEKVWITSDDEVRFYTGIANDSSSYTYSAYINNTGIHTALNVTAKLVAATDAVQIGDAYLKWDATNKAVYVVNKNGTTAAGFYATGFVSAKGVSNSTPVLSSLSGLSDVQITSPANGQALKYDSASGKWVNGTIDSFNSGQMWTELFKSDSSKVIDISHIPVSTLNGYYVKKSGDTMTGLLTVKSEASHTGIKIGGTYITAISSNIIFQNNAAIRFGNDEWNWNTWAGLKYAPSSKSIYLGLADKTIFDANTAQSEGNIFTPGISRIYVGNNTSNIVWHAGNDGSGSGLDADLLDGYNESSFLRYRAVAASGGDSNTLWNQIGIKQYESLYPDGVTNKIYSYGQVISFATIYTRLDIYSNHKSSSSEASYASNGIQYRSGWNADKNPWRMLLDNVNYTSYVDTRYVKKAGDTMIGDLTVINEKGYSIGWMTRQVRTNGVWMHGGADGATSTDANLRFGSWYGVGWYPTVANQPVSQGNNAMWLNVRNGNLDVAGRFKSNVATGTQPYQCSSTTLNTNLNADLLDGLHLTDIRVKGYAMQDTWIDASALNVNTWYPVTIVLSTIDNARIEILVPLNSGTKPSWSTHNNGFSVRVIWEVNGYGWGTNASVNRNIYVSEYRHTDMLPVRGIGQMMNSSTEVVYVRGGGKYMFRTSNGLIPVLRTTTYTTNDQSVAPTTTAPAAISRSNALITDNVASATKLQTARTLWGQSFDGTANVSGNMTGVGTITASGRIYTSADVLSEGWLRTKGSAGWYSETYTGGWHMTDTNYIRNFNAKRLRLQTSTYDTLQLVRTESNGGSSIAFYNAGGTFRGQFGCTGASWFSFDTGTATANQNVVEISPAGGLHSKAEITAKASGSDIRLKKDICAFHAMGIIHRFRSVKYHWNDIAKANSEVYNNDYWQYGLIAQDLLAGGYEQWVRDVFHDYYTIAYERLIPVVWKGLQEVDSEVERLKRRVKYLEEEIEQLKDK